MLQELTHCDKGHKLVHGVNYSRRINNRGRIIHTCSTCEAMPKVRRTLERTTYAIPYYPEKAARLPYLTIHNIDTTESIRHRYRPQANNGAHYLQLAMELTPRYTQNRSPYELYWQRRHSELELSIAVHPNNPSGLTPKRPTRKPKPYTGSSFPGDSTDVRRCVSGHYRDVNTEVTCERCKFVKQNTQPLPEGIGHLLLTQTRDSNASEVRILPRTTRHNGFPEHKCPHGHILPDKFHEIRYRESIYAICPSCIITGYYDMPPTPLQTYVPLRSEKYTGGGEIGPGGFCNFGHELPYKPGTDGRHDTNGTRYGKRCVKCAEAEYHDSVRLWDNTKILDDLGPQKYIDAGDWPDEEFQALYVAHLAKERELWDKLPHPKPGEHVTLTPEQAQYMEELERMAPETEAMEAQHARMTTSAWGEIWEERLRDKWEVGA